MVFIVLLWMRQSRLWDWRLLIWVRSIRKQVYPYVSLCLHSTNSSSLLVDAFNARLYECVLQGLAVSFCRYKPLTRSSLLFLWNHYQDYCQDSPHCSCLVRDKVRTATWIWILISYFSVNRRKGYIGLRLTRRVPLRIGFHSLDDRLTFYMDFWNA